MGLDVSHNAWHGAYSAFSRWRNTIAEAAGFRLHDSDLGPSCWQPEWNDLPDLQDKLDGRWDTPPDDPLLVLLIHSDCDGVIPKTVAPFLAERLERLLPDLPNEDVGGHIGDFQAKTMQFIAGLRAAAEKGEDLEFF